MCNTYEQVANYFTPWTPRSHQAEVAELFNLKLNWYSRLISNCFSRSSFINGDHIPRPPRLRRYSLPYDSFSPVRAKRTSPSVRLLRVH
jgi:hypothetical protein